MLTLVRAETIRNHQRREGKEEGMMWRVSKAFSPSIQGMYINERKRKVDGRDGEERSERRERREDLPMVDGSCLGRKGGEGGGWVAKERDKREGRGEREGDFYAGEIEPPLREEGEVRIP